MSDIRELIAEGRALLAAFDETPASNQAFDLAGWAGVNARALLDALEDALREPVGYVVLAKNPSDITPGKTNYRTPAAFVHRDDRDMAITSLRAHRNGRIHGWEKAWHGQCEYVLGEVREVRS